MDVLDSRDLQERIEELETELGALTEDLEAAEEENDEAAVRDAKHAIEEWKEEIDALTALKDYCWDSGWRYGIAFIAEDDFEEYAQDLASDLYGEEIRNAHWPFGCRDWEMAANALRQDYSSIDYRGTTYLFRS